MSARKDGRPKLHHLPTRPLVRFLEATGMARWQIACKLTMRFGGDPHNWLRLLARLDAQEFAQVWTVDRIAACFGRHLADFDPGL